MEYLFETVLNPLNIKPDALNLEFLGERTLLAETEKIRICHQFRETSFSEAKQRRLEAYYGKHQAMLVELCDKIYHYLDRKRPESIYKLTSDEGILNLYKAIMKVPEALLNFIEQYFPEYFYDKCKVPDSKCREYITQIKKELNGIKKGLIKLDIYEGLTRITADAFENYRQPAQVMSYQELYYLQNLQTALSSFTKTRPIQNADELLCHLLLQLNFNGIRFFNYFIERMQERSRQCNSSTELIEFYSQELKIINQLQVKPGLAFKPGLPAAREQVGSWICEELAFLEKKRRLNTAAAGEPGQHETVKVHTSLSVAQLALAVKLLMDVKLITNKNAAELMRMVASSFKTDRQEMISEESLRNKSYSFETSTVNRMKDVVIELLNMVRRY